MIRSILGTLAVAACLAACGSNQAQQAQRGQSEAEHLQEYCKRAGLNNAETQRADASLSSAAKHHKDGDDAEAVAESDLAATLFRLALARKDLADVQAEVAVLKQGLSKDKDQLQTYQEILSEMKTTRKP
jgi:predicted Ser/Thr protein kinase